MKGIKEWLLEAGIDPVPNEFVIYGVGPVEISVSEYEVIKDHLIEFYGFEIVAQEENAILLEVGEGGNGAQIILKEDTESPVAKEGNGEVHHLALRVLRSRKSIEQVEGLYEKNNFHHSGFIERHYFGALYVRLGRVLFELSSDDPGFTIDEPYETLGESSEHFRENLKISGHSSKMQFVRLIQQLTTQKANK